MADNLTADKTSRKIVKHYPALDGIRGLAITLILFFHLLWANAASGSKIFDLISKLRAHAWVGVDLFFVLSGFLITGILYDSLNDGQYFKKFYVRRFLRIFPLYYGVLFVLLLLTHPLHLVWQGRQYVLLAYLQNTGIWFPIMDFKLNPAINLTHFWSLAVEEQFYLVWPILVFWIRDVRKLIAATVLLSVAALVGRVVLIHAGVPLMLLHTWTPCRADTLLIGGGLALIMRTKYERRVWPWAVVILSIALCSLAFGWLGAGDKDYTQSIFLSTFGYTLIALACASLIALTFPAASPIRAIFENRVLRFLGKYSYGIYVFHLIFDSLLTNQVRTHIYAATHSKALSVAAGALIVLMVTLSVALLSYYFYELPFLKLKKYFEYSSDKRKDVITATVG